MSTGLELAKIHVELTKGLCCEERRQEVGEEGYDRASLGHCSPRNNSLFKFIFLHSFFTFIHSKNIVNWGIAINNVMIVSGEQ